MKATTWLCPVLTLLCATRLVCTAQRGGYPLDYADSNMIQDDYLLEKRNKPSLSIVNPMDVLRQRLLLETARRQMKENNRQVERNRAILKNVGKREPATRRYQMSLQQQQQQLQQLQQHLPPQLRYMLPTLSIFDYLQLPTYEALLDDEKKSLDRAAAAAAAAAAKQRLNGNEIGNETNHGGSNANNKKNNDIFATATDAVADGGNPGLNLVAAGLGLADAQEEDEEADAANIANSDNDLANEANGGYQLRYLYRLHKNHFAKK